MDRFTFALITTTLSTYLLVALGAMTATTGGFSPIAVGHYLAAGGVWALLVAVTVLAWRNGHERKVRLGVSVATAVYPVQAFLGMAGAFEMFPVGSSSHLLGGIAVFALLLVTLVWHLDGEITVETPPKTGPIERDDNDDASDSATDSRLPEGVRAYIELTKPRLMWLLSLLAVAGMALATITGATLDGITVVATVLGGVLAVGAAGTFNHVYERDRDRRMSRTDDRPLATASVSPLRATAFGIGLFVTAMVVLLIAVNPLAAALTAVAVVYYAVVYTVILKPTTTWNTVIGGGAGALPAVIGWVAVTGSIGLPALVLAAVVFCWTPAHFYNLAIAYRDDYARGGYPMLSVVKGIDPTRRRILYWLGATLLVSGALGVVADFGPVYAVTSAGVGFVFVWTVARQFRTGTDLAAYRSFHASNAYLGAILVAILVETLVI